MADATEKVTDPATKEPTPVPANQETPGEAHSSESTPPKVSTTPQPPVVKPGEEKVYDPDKQEKETDKEQPADKKPNEPPKEQDNKVKATDIVPVDHEDANIRAVQSILADNKVTEGDASKIFGKAVESLKIEDVDMQALTSKVGDANARLIVAGLKQWYDNTAAPHIETANKVYAAFGGKAGWEAARNFFNTKVDAGTFKSLTAMLDAGGLQAELATQKMVQMYVSDPNTKTGILPISTTNSNLQQGPVNFIKSRREFAEKLMQCSTVEERAKVQHDWLASKANK